MHVLRPFLVAVLGAFVAAAPAAPVPWRVKKERQDPSDGGEARGHHQKLEEPERQVPAEASAYGSKVCVATGGERAPAPAGDAAQPAAFCGSDPRCDYPVPAARRAPTPTLAAPRPADLHAGLLALPPPAPRFA
ncbi:MAG: hypothetical protein ACYTDU_07075 [Planctomycetota bacterium]